MKTPAHPFPARNWLTRLTVLCLLLGLTVSPLAAQTKPRTGPATKATRTATTDKGDSIGSILATGGLATAYNPVLLGYLLEEGKAKLPEGQRKKAIDQLVARFKEEMDVTPAEQLLGSAVALGGMLGGSGWLAQGLAEGSARAWSDWVDAALLLNRAGYKQEVIPFFRNCIRAYPYEVLREKCVVGLVAADPAAALEIVTALEKEAGEVKSTALRLMGLLASQARLPKAQKDALVETLIARTQGLQTESHSLAAIHGLALAGDPRAVEPLRKMTKGLARGELVERAAKRALLITFKDAEIVPTLEKNAKGGFGSNDDDKLFAGALLIEAGHDSGYAWAKERLTKKKGGLSRLKKGGPDILDEIVWALANRGGKKSIPVLQAALPIRKPTEWLSAYIAVSLLDLGDPAGMEVAKMALSNDRWLTTRLEAVEALAAHGDLSGLGVLEQLTADKSFFKKASDLSLGKFRDADAVKAAVASSIADMDVPEGVDLLLALLRDDSDEVRTAAAYAFGRMKTPRAVEGLAAGLAADYGKDGARARSPEVKAHLLRTALQRFPRHLATKQMVESAGSSEFLSVRFLAIVAGRIA